jgi:glycosyltransferase involved in cell wall biosynthesis
LSGEQSTVAAAVSVVVPSYNHARFVGAAPARLVVIDDGSEDDSVRVVERALADCPFPCELIARPNRGLCATLNEGLARTGGEFFAYLASDDLWLPGFLEARARLLGARPRAALAYGHCFLIDEDDRVVDCTRDWATYADGDARAMLLQTIAPMSPTVVYRREAVARHGWNERARLEDYELYLRLAPEGEFAFDPRVHAAWRRHGSNTSRGQRMMLEEQLAAQRRVLPAYGFGDAEVARLHARLRFSRAEDFLRLGDKREALRLMRANLRGATARTAARLLPRLLLPYSLVRRRDSRRHHRAIEKYGGIKP